MYPLNFHVDASYLHQQKVGWGLQPGRDAHYDFKVKPLNDWLQAGGSDSDMIVMIDG